MSYIGDRNAMLRRLDLIHTHHQPWLRIFDIPVRVYNARSMLKDRLDLLRYLSLASHVRPVDLSNQSLHHGRPRRNLADLNACAVFVADRVH